MRYRLLGSVEVYGDDGQLLPIGGRSERVLLTVLALHANRAVSTDRLIDALWGDDPPATATNALQVHISKLRKHLAGGSGRDLLRRAAGGYVLQVETGESDVESFDRLTREAASVGDPSEVSRLLAEGLSLWRGAPLSGADSDALAGEAARLEEQRLAAIERRVDAELELAGHRELIPELEGLVHDYPLREELRGRLMLILYRSGRQTEALAVYREGRERLAEEMGIDPGPDLQAVELKILQQSPDIGPPVVTGGDRIPPGRHRKAAHNLPEQLSPLVGRQADTAALRRLLGEERLVTLVGAGGVGKTRLALQVAWDLVGQTSDGVRLADLASLRWPDLVVSRIADSTGVPEQPGRPRQETLLDLLRPQELLLVLDNCEHLIEACAGLSEELLKHCPGVRILATSREPLGAEGEHLFRVSPLAVPADPDADRAPTGGPGQDGALNNLASNQMEAGDTAGAVVNLREAIGIVAELLGDSCMLAMLLLNYGTVAVIEGDCGVAGDRFGQAFEVSERVGSWQVSANAVMGLAWCAVADGDLSRAAYLYGVAETINDQVGEIWQAPESRLVEEGRRQMLAALGPDGYGRAYEAGWRRAADWRETDARERTRIVGSG